MRDTFVRCEIDTHGARAVVAPDHLLALTAGHFPDDPLLPGAQQLALMVEVAERVAAPAHLQMVVRCTFAHRVRPTMRVVIEAGRTGPHVACRLLADDVVAAEAMLELTA